MLKGSVKLNTLAANVDFGVTVYEFFGGDGASSTALPSEFRLGNPLWAQAIETCTLNSGDGFGSGGLGANLFNIELGGSEQFDIVSGHGYGVHAYSLVPGGTGARSISWDYADTSAYANGAYGRPNSDVAPNQFDLGLAISAVPVSQVPLPAAAWLFISAIAGLAGAKRMSRSKAPA